MATALSIAFTPTPVPSNTNLVIEATGQISAGKNFVPRSAYKLLTVQPAATASPFNALALYTAMFGSLVAGQAIFFRLRQINATGFASDPIETRVVVT